MALTLAVADVLSARAWNSVSEQAAVSTFNFFVASVTGGGITDQDFCDAIAPTFASFFTQTMPGAGQHHGTQVYFLRRTGFLPAPVKNTLSAGAGVQTGNPVPRNAAAILKYSTNTRGPGGRGRVFAPFTAAVFLTAIGVPTAAYAVLANSFLSSILTPITVTIGGNSASFVWTLVTRHPKPAPITTNPMLSAESAQRFGQMHKRGDYGRANSSPI